MATRTTKSKADGEDSAAAKAAATKAKKDTTAEKPKKAATGAAAEKATAGKPASTRAKSTAKAADAPAAEAVPKAPAKKKSAAASAESQVSPELRQQYIAEAAYFIAERRGFAGGTHHDDWLEAEALIDRMLSGSASH